MLTFSDILLITMESNVDVSQNIFKILVATDIHLGYMEKDAERSM